MSDTDDGFDKEAVRRELREKYENDDRGETERMSELLLQGATMTNQHCENCGSPIFRYDGQAFCPNCQQTGGQQAPADGQATEGSQAGAENAAGAGTAPNAADTANVADAPNAADAADDAPRSADVDADAGRRQPPSEAGDSRDGGRGRSPAGDQPPIGDQPRPSGQSGSQTAPSGEAADALESAVAAMARRAAGSDDPRRAREYLEAAREAAEALATLRHKA